MERFAKLILAARIPILILAVLITAAFASRLPTLTADDDVMQFLPQEDPDIILFNRVNERFGGLDVAIVGLETDSMFTAETIAKVRKLTQAVGQIDGVFDVTSFTEVPDPQPAPDGLRVEPLVMDKIPSSPEELANLKRRVLANDNAVGAMISKDGKAAMVLCFLGGNRPPIHIAADIKKTAAGIWNTEPIYFGGSPFIRLYVAGGTKEDLIWLTPIVALVVLFVTFLIFRKPLGVLLALGTVGVALVWLIGILALRGKGITLVGSSLPTILVAIGGAYGIHILSAYFNGTSKTVRERIIEAMKSVGAPVIASALTTCAGFLSFLVMDMAPLRDFGVFAAVGVGITALLTMTVIPAVLSFSKKVPVGLGTALLAAPLGRIGGWAARKRGLAIAMAVGLAVAGVAGVLRIAPDPTLETFFAEGSEPDQANEFLVRNFGGSNYLQIYFEGDMRSPFVLAQLRKAVEYAKGRTEVVQVNSIIDPLVMMSEAMGGRADLPINNKRTGFLYPFLDGTAAIEQMIAPRKDSSLVQIRLAAVEPEAVDRTVKDIREFINKEIPRGIKIVKVGEFAVPEEADEFVDPAEYDKDGKIVREVLPTKIHVPESEKALNEYRAMMEQEVAARVVRLSRIYGGIELSDETTASVLQILRKNGASGDLPPGEDLEAAVRKIVDEHVAGEVPVFEEPFEDATDLEKVEWEKRGELSFAALLPLAGTRLNASAVTTALQSKLPLTCARDPEGEELTSSAIAMGMSQSRAQVRALRLANPVLEAAGVLKPSDELVNKVAWAITDLDMPVYGFPDTGADASTVLARVTGQPVINVALCNSTIKNQLKSLALALVVLTLIMSFFFKSALSGFKALIPAIFMLCMAVGVMGAAAIPLDLTTSMIAAIALGIGVDYSIHFLWRRKRRGESLRLTTAGVGPSIAGNAVQVAAGFAVLAFSDMVPMQRFGLLVALTMLLSAAATFVLLPALRAEGTELLGEESEDIERATSHSS